ncbi:antibiotic biosynthesis monooxygenase family protein [Blastomonas aquatica]|uniref:Polysaccharide biosynthesis protein n=1 Tax=Blastomonas aquatica TaxID=1510276 RepID=A0ABQ1J5C5_9SPHN|nr:antibiotic biosynthesis monooxygenase [Blastomonas aquatica]GGB60032.1 polysaccharide biosynthesis protein [Blastomonas aquatica]
MLASTDSRIHATDAIAVIFAAQHSGRDTEGYRLAAAAMDALAAQQPGFLGMDHSSSAEGFGITVSYWTDDASAKAWRDNPEHAAARESGRARWYTRYTIHVARIERGYAWP